MSVSNRRSPGNSVHQVHSENDKAEKRQKRTRNELQQKIENESLKDDLLAMLNKWKSDQDIALNKLFSEITELKQQNANIQTTSAEMEKAMQFMSKQYKDLQAKFLDLERERRENLQYITTLENKIDSIQKRSKFTVVEVRNLPMPQEIRQETQQDLYDIFQKICDAINISVQPIEVKDIYRIKNKTGTSTVVSELTTVLTKNKILSAVKHFNKTNPNSKLSTASIGIPGDKKPIYITESLTNTDRKLFAMARDIGKTMQYKYCWATRGRIFLRKSEGVPRIEIKNESDLTALRKT